MGRIGMFVVVVAGLIVPASVRAQSSGTAASETPPGDAPDVELAQRLFRAAIQAFDRGQTEEALRLFRGAYEAAPRAAVRFNIAVCLERLGRFREAWLEYRAAIDPDEFSPAQLAQAQQEEARLRGMLAVVEVSGEPAGADVRIDGISLCSLPCTTEVDPGDRVVSIHSAGQSAERGVRLDRGQRLAFELSLASPLPEEVSPPPTFRVEPVAEVPERQSPGHSIGWLTGVGVGLAAIGVGGLIGFGLRTQTLHEQWEAGGPNDVRDEGLTMRALTNISIGVAALGATLVVVDLILAATNRGGDRAQRHRPLRF